MEDASEEPQGDDTETLDGRGPVFRGPRSQREVDSILARLRAGN